MMGPDGNLWFAELHGNRIGRVNVRFILRRPAAHSRLNLVKLQTLDGSGRPQTTFRARQKGYVQVSWTVSNLAGSTTIVVKRTYQVPNGSRWTNQSADQSNEPVHNGSGSATFQFIAPIHYTSFRIAVSIKFQSKWSAARAVTVRIAH
jgi:hypothetical protein